MVEEAEYAQSEVPVEVEEKIVRIDRKQDRYRIEIVDPQHRSLKVTLWIYKVTSLTAETASRPTNT